MALDNPFGPGRVGNDGGDPFKVPHFEHLTEAQADAENVDTEEEKAYGEMKRQERIRILQEDETVGPPLKKAKKRKYSIKSHLLYTDESLYMHQTQRRSSISSLYRTMIPPARRLPAQPYSQSQCMSVKMVRL